MKKEERELKKMWYQGSLGAIVFLVIFFPIGLYLMWRHTKWNKKTKLAITGFFLLMIIVASNVDSKSGGTKEAFNAGLEAGKQVGNKSAPTPTPTSTKEASKTENKQEEKKESSLERIRNIVKEKSSGVEATIFSGDDLANNNNPPYNIVINYPFDHSVSSCFEAKSASHEIVKSLYSDSLVRSNIDRVLIIIPYYLKMSLGSADGVLMGEKNTFNGPTLFWKTLVDSTGYEKEGGELRDRTWGVLLDKCK